MCGPATLCKITNEVPNDLIVFDNDIQKLGFQTLSTILDHKEESTPHYTSCFDIRRMLGVGVLVPRSEGLYTARTR